MASKKKPEAPVFPDLLSDDEAAAVDAMARAPEPAGTGSVTPTTVVSASVDLRVIADDFAEALVAAGRDPEMVKDAIDFLLSEGDEIPFVAESEPEPVGRFAAHPMVKMYCDRNEISVVRIGRYAYATPFGTTVEIPRNFADIYRTAGKE